MNILGIRNPVLSSPWASNAPRGYSHSSKKLPLSFFSDTALYDISDSKAQQTTTTPRAHRHRNILQENQLFKNLNKSTLVLSFPDIHPKQIDAALALCDNDLSETIGLLQLRTRILINRKLRQAKRSVRKFVPIVPKQNVPLKIVKYIPTKYTDVQIVEVTNTININNNNLKIVEVNNDVLQMLETCETTIIQPTTIAQDNLFQSTISTSSSRSEISLVPPFSPAPASTSSSVAHSDDSNKLKIINIVKYPETQECIVVPHKKFLERALTFCTPCSQENI